LANIEELRRQQEEIRLENERLEQFGRDIRKPGGKLTY
jgi:hypothetical protein